MNDWSAGCPAGRCLRRSRFLIDRLQLPTSFDQRGCHRHAPELEPLVDAAGDTLNLRQRRHEKKETAGHCVEARPDLARSFDDFLNSGMGKLTISAWLQQHMQAPAAAQRHSLLCQSRRRRVDCSPNVIKKKIPS
jgi:hypothetical protein